MVIGTESWLTNDHLDSEIFPRLLGFTSFCRDRASGSKSDGVFILTKDSPIAFRQCNLETNSEIIWVKVEISQSKSLYVAAYYRLQENDSQSLEEFRAALNIVSKKKGHTWTPSSEFVSSSIPSWQILTAHAQPFRGARDLAFCMKVPLDSLLVWASSGGSGETARMRRLAWTFAARIGDKYQIRLTRSTWNSGDHSFPKFDWDESHMPSIRQGCSFPRYMMIYLYFRWF